MHGAFWACSTGLQHDSALLKDVVWVRLALQVLSYLGKILDGPGLLAPGCRLGCSVLAVGLGATMKGMGREGKKRTGKESKENKIRTHIKSHSEILLKILLIW